MSNVIEILGFPSNEKLKKKHEKEKVFGTDFDVAEFSDLFFVSYEKETVGDQIGKWIRIPYLTHYQMLMVAGDINFDKVENFKVVPYTEMIKPLDKDGLSKEDCEHLGRDFVPFMLKGEFEFGHQYGIHPEFGLMLRDDSIERHRKQYGVV